MDQKLTFGFSPEMSAFIAAFSGIILIIVALSLIDLYLRGKSLWRSAQAGEKGWFVALLIVNSLGILPTIYLLTHKNKAVETKLSDAK